jgi:hypothetical protein
MPHAQGYHRVILLGSLVCIFARGGAVLRFDPASGAWSTLAPTRSNREHGAPFVMDGSLYVAGGHAGASRSSVDNYDVASDTWKAVAVDMLEGRWVFGAVIITSSGPAEEQDLFDLLIAKASNGHQ